MTRWWRSHSVHMRLTLWYVGVMIVVLGVYAVGVYAFVSRSVSQALNDRLRADFFWGFGDAAASQAGKMRQQGRMWVLLPKGYVPPAAETRSP